LLSEDFIYEKLILKQKQGEEASKNKKRRRWRFTPWSPSSKKNEASIKAEDLFKTKVVRELNRSIIAQLFRLDLGTFEVEIKLQFLKDAIATEANRIELKLSELVNEMESPNVSVG
jgi:hypothetical protein